MSSTSVPSPRCASPWFALRLAHALGWRTGRMLWEPFAVPALAVAAGAWAGARIAPLFAAPWLALIAAAAVAGTVSALLLFVLRHVRADEFMSLVRRGAAA